MKTILKKTKIMAGMQFKDGKTVNNNIHEVGYYITKLVYSDNNQLLIEKKVKQIIY